MNVACTLVLLVMFVCFVNAHWFPVTCRTHKGVRLLDGDDWNDPERCSLYRCTIVNGQAELFGLRCAAFHVPQGCKAVKGFGKLYPDCCPTVVCT
uniref:Toxin protein n=1 Tax=Hemiscorpius lepturus TaxID=520031 RepID=A0A1L4BJ52_HEMLE|nr:toxin protein [Hemiscorpius lepturus]